MICSVCPVCSVNGIKQILVAILESWDKKHCQNSPASTTAQRAWLSVPWHENARLGTGQLEQPWAPLRTRVTKAHCAGVAQKTDPWQRLWGQTNAGGTWQLIFLSAFHLHLLRLLFLLAPLCLSILQCSYLSIRPFQVDVFDRRDEWTSLSLPLVCQLSGSHSISQCDRYLFMGSEQLQYNKLSRELSRPKIARLFAHCSASSLFAHEVAAKSNTQQGWDVITMRLSEISVAPILL